MGSTFVSRGAPFSWICFLKLNRFWLPAMNRISVNLFCTVFFCLEYICPIVTLPFSTTYFHLYQPCLHFFFPLISLWVHTWPQGTNVFSPFVLLSYPPSCPLYLCISPLFHTLSILAPLLSFNLETFASPTPQRVTLSTGMWLDWSNHKLYTQVWMTEFFKPHLEVTKDTQM